MAEVLGMEMRPFKEMNGGLCLSTEVCAYRGKPVRTSMVANLLGDPSRLTGIGVQFIAKS